MIFSLVFDSQSFSVKGFGCLEDLLAKIRGIDSQSFSVKDFVCLEDLLAKIDFDSLNHFITPSLKYPRAFLFWL